MGSLIYFSTVLDNMVLTAVRQEVNNLESSVVLQELELAIKSCFIGFLWRLGSQYNFVLIFFSFDTEMKKCMSKMPIDNHPLT